MDEWAVRRGSAAAQALGSVSGCRTNVVCVENLSWWKEAIATAATQQESKRMATTRSKGERAQEVSDEC